MCQRQPRGALEQLLDGDAAVHEQMRVGRRGANT